MAGVEGEWQVVAFMQIFGTGHTSMTRITCDVISVVVE